MVFEIYERECKIRMRGPTISPRASFYFGAPDIDVPHWYPTREAFFWRLGAWVGISSKCQVEWQIREEKDKDKYSKHQATEGNIIGIAR